MNLRASAARLFLMEYKLHIGCRSALLPHHPEVVLGVLVEVLGLDGFAATGRVFGKIRVTLIVVARVRRNVTWIAGGTNA
jgi:hypothetical protein